MIQWYAIILWNYESRYFNDMKNDMKWSDSIWYEMIWNDSDMIKIWDDDTRSTDIWYQFHWIALCLHVFTIIYFKTLSHACVQGIKKIEFKMFVRVSLVREIGFTKRLNLKVRLVNVGWSTRSEGTCVLSKMQCVLQKKNLIHIIYHASYGIRLFVQATTAPKEFWKVAVR